MADPTALAYVVLGVVLSLSGAVTALLRVRATRSYYAANVYHMTARSHWRFAILSVVTAVAFVFALRWPAIEMPLLAVYVLLLVLYASSFARGFSDEDE